MQDTLTVVLAGGMGSRLSPLTDDRAKPAVPFVENIELLISHSLIASIPDYAKY